MTSTDRAFIAAFHHTTLDPVDQSVKSPVVPTPAHRRAGLKATLSEHLARRSAENTPSETPEIVIETEAFQPAVLTPALAWPEVVTALAEQGRGPLLETLSSVTGGGKQATSVVAFVGAVHGVGSTTALLAMAKLVSSIGGAVAVIDATDGGDAAAQLGVRRNPRSFPSQEIDHLVVGTIDGSTSILRLGAEAPVEFASAAICRLSSAHDLVLIDAGQAETTVDWVSDSQIDAVLLVDALNGRCRSAAAEQLARRGASTQGVLETGLSIAS